MEMIGFLVLFPIIGSLGWPLVIRQNTARNIIVCVSAAIIGIGSIVIVAMNLGTSGQYFYFQSDIVDYVCLGVSVLDRHHDSICYAVKYKVPIGAYSGHYPACWNLGF